MLSENVVIYLLRRRSRVPVRRAFICLRNVFA